jgi:hypothetical protein
MGVDTGNPKEIGVLLTERGSLDSKVFAFQFRPDDKNGAFLGALTGSAFLAGSGPQAGETIRFFHNRKSGLITRMVGSDRSRIDLRWDRTKGYRRAVVIVRDGSGNKLNSLARASIRAKSLDPSELLLYSDVPT